MASTFPLLEIAHTHYSIKDNKTDSSPMSERNSPLSGSRESLSSIDPNISNPPVPNPPNVGQQAPPTSVPASTNNSTTGFVAHLGKRKRKATLFFFDSFNFHWDSLFPGSLWRESKLALARSYATATQGSMNFGPSVELRTNPKHSFSPHVPFHSTLTVSPSLSSGLNSNELKSSRSITSTIHDSHSGTSKCCLSSRCCCCSSCVQTKTIDHCLKLIYLFQQFLKRMAIRVKRIHRTTSIQISKNCRIEFSDRRVRFVQSIVINMIFLYSRCGQSNATWFIKFYQRGPLKFSFRNKEKFRILVNSKNANQFNVDRRRIRSRFDFINSTSIENKSSSDSNFNAMDQRRKTENKIDHSHQHSKKFLFSWLSVRKRIHRFLIGNFHSQIDSF